MNKFLLARKLRGFFAVYKGQYSKYTVEIIANILPSIDALSKSLKSKLSQEEKREVTQGDIVRYPSERLMKKAVDFLDAEEKRMIRAKKKEEKVEIFPEQFFEDQEKRESRKKARKDDETIGASHLFENAEAEYKLQESIEKIVLQGFSKISPEEQKKKFILLFNAYSSLKNNDLFRDKRHIADFIKLNMSNISAALIAEYGIYYCYHNILPLFPDNLKKFNIYKEFFYESLEHNSKLFLQQNPKIIKKFNIVNITEYTETEIIAKALEIEMEKKVRKQFAAQLKDSNKITQENIINNAKTLLKNNQNLNAQDIGRFLLLNKVSFSPLIKIRTNILEKEFGKRGVITRADMAYIYAKEGYNKRIDISNVFDRGESGVKSLFNKISQRNSTEIFGDIKISFIKGCVESGKIKMLLQSVTTLKKQTGKEVYKIINHIVKNCIEYDKVNSSNRVATLLRKDNLQIVDDYICEKGKKSFESFVNNNIPNKKTGNCTHFRDLIEVQRSNIKNI